MRPARRTALLAFAIAAAPTAAAPPPPPAPIAKAVAAANRAPTDRARDRYRHPAETLAFFGIAPGETVVEDNPGGGWYTDILAPLVGPGGRLYAAQPAGRAKDALAARFAAAPAVFGRAVLVAWPPAPGAIPDGSADAVVTFRNVHNMVMRGDAAATFARFYALLKPGGTLGIEDHRLPEDRDTALEASSGYVKVSTVRRLAEAAGFVFAGGSEVNANPRDTADWPKGVWTLPPTYALGDTDRARYAAIGESDRMTLRFRKPPAPRH